jgi:hypothetical protein
MTSNRQKSRRENSIHKPVKMAMASLRCPENLRA